MTDTKVRVVAKRITVVEEWVPMGGLPHPCMCGHDHWARARYVDKVRTDPAVEYGICEEPDCSCTVLRPVSDR